MRYDFISPSPVIYRVQLDLLTVVGIQFVLMGLLGEINVRIFHESRTNPFITFETHPTSSPALHEGSDPTGRGRDALSC